MSCPGRHEHKGGKFWRKDLLIANNYRLNKAAKRIFTR